MNRVYASDEAREYATSKAQELQEKLVSGYPSFVKPMTQSHVTGGFWLVIKQKLSTVAFLDLLMIVVSITGRASRCSFAASICPRVTSGSLWWMRRVMRPKQTTLVLRQVSAVAGYGSPRITALLMVIVWCLS
jgi:hypothetical protein